MAKVSPKSWFHECMLLIGQNKHSKFTYNTLRILPVTMTCAVHKSFSQGKYCTQLQFVLANQMQLSM